MFDIGWTEMLVVAVVAIIVVGPKDLPKVLRGFGRIMSSLRGMASDFQKQFDDAIREAELDEVKELAKGKTFQPLDDIKKATDKYKQDFQDSIKGTVKELNEAAADNPKRQKSASQTAKSADRLPEPKKPDTETTPASKPAKPSKTTSKTAEKTAKPQAASSTKKTASKTVPRRKATGSKSSAKKSVAKRQA